MRVIVTGATGMVGEGVLLVCLNSPLIEEAVVLVRRSTGMTHPKLKEIVHPDFLDLSPVESQLAGYDACYHCAGVSSVGISADEYYRATYQLTMHLADTLVSKTSGMTFCYVSGMGTDGTEKGRSRWARVKGKTENDLMKKNFKQVFVYRPGFMKAMPGMKHVLPYYKYVNWMFAPGKALYPAAFNTLEEVGISMINAARFGYSKNVITGNDIRILAAMG